MAICLVRTVIVYITILFSMRIMGKRQIGELAPSELVVAVLISDLAANPLQDIGIPLLYGLMPVLVLLCCEVLISQLIYRRVKCRAILCGKPSIIINDGVIDQNEMHSNRYTPDDLQASLRQNGVLDISEVMSAVLETNGTLSVILKPDAAPPTARDAGIKVKSHGYPITVICEGRILSDNLKLAGKDEKWLNHYLQENAISSSEDVYLLTVESGEKCYLAKKVRKK